MVTSKNFKKDVLMKYMLFERKYPGYIYILLYSRSDS